MPRPTRNAGSPFADDQFIKPLLPGAGSSLAVQAYEAIHALLFRGVFRQGTFLRMEEFCMRLGISKQPIADAFKRLAHEGYVTILPQIGCQVRVYTYDEVRDYYRLYAAAEGLLAEFAASRATTLQLNQLDAASATIGEFISKIKPEPQEAAKYRRLNQQFHRLLRQAAASCLVAEGAAAMQDRSDFFTVTMQHRIHQDRLQLAHKEHETLLAALHARDPASARAAMESHVLAVGTRLWQPNKNPS